MKVRGGKRSAHIMAIVGSSINLVCHMLSLFVGIALDRYGRMEDRVASYAKI